MTSYPSGNQYEITRGDQQATVVGVGGGIRAYALAGRPVLDGYPADQMCTGARGTPLIPWPNRLADGAYTFAGVDHQLPLTEPATRTAIHGLTRWHHWQLREYAPDQVTLGTVLAPQPGYPFTLHLTVSYHLGGDSGLTVATTATNFGDGPCPYATGHHPYLTAGTDHIDDCDLHLDASRWLPTDDRGLPTGTTAVRGSDYDFHVPRRIGDTVIDNAFTGLVRDADGLAWLSLTAPDGHRVRLWIDEQYRYLELYTGDTQPPDVRRRGLGVEPMTCAPNGLATGDGLIVLEPGRSLTTRWGIRPD